jgi:hypothetical protein
MIVCSTTYCSHRATQSLVILHSNHNNDHDFSMLMRTRRLTIVLLYDNTAMLIDGG